MKKDKIFAIIPAFNEEKTIQEVIRGVKKHLANIIVIDDGSTDKTAILAKKNNVRVLRHVVNLGKGAALKTGCQAALKLGAEGFIVLDADGQHLAKDIPRFLSLLIKNDKIFVLGTRTKTKKRPYIRLFGSSVFGFFIKIFFHKKLSDPLCGFRAFSKSVFQKINWGSSGYGVEIEMIIKAVKNNIKMIQTPISTVYLDKYKGVTFATGIRIFLDMFVWRISR